MKKILIVLTIFIIILVNIKKEEEVFIPNDAIRIRIIANSNSIEDQYNKIVVEENITKYLNSLLVDVKTKEETKKIILDNINNIGNVVSKSYINKDYKVEYGYNYFPNKLFKGVKYKEGNYESLVITLGNGLGENWWCVLFPPLCLMENDSNVSDIEYKFYIKELVEKYS